MTRDLGGAKIYLKRGGSQPHWRAQDQQRARTGAAREKDGQNAAHRRTGAGQHGVATATAAALMGMDCVVYMGKGKAPSARH